MSHSAFRISSHYNIGTDEEPLLACGRHFRQGWTFIASKLEYVGCTNCRQTNVYRDAVKAAQAEVAQKEAQKEIEAVRAAVARLRLNLYQVEYDNCESYDAHYQTTLGQFSSLELAKAYCVAQNAHQYDIQPWREDWVPFAWEGEWSHHEAEENTFGYQTPEHWKHSEISGDWGDRGGEFTIILVQVDPEPPAPAENNWKP